ncbi:ATP-binding protein [Candidatus Desantisbacteria bacterium]|nr:ATP-binding protein [Candidatus Desantisbacteria bacterium]
MYPLSGKQIDIFFGKLKTCLNGEAEDAGYSLNLFRKIINDYTRQPLDELAKRVETVYDWNDLILHKTVIEHLKAFRNTIANRFTVYEKWGLGEKLPRGRGVTALFTGMPGTGKTMAAEAIARDLGINLYHVDLAGMVSKYVGETEKNIRKIFESARDANVLLFFDEADTLFGRRTEIKDSHDRYANLEVNYLLQRLEEHEGSVILATNMKKNMDEAFSRRIHFIIEFPLPSESQRRIILQKHLPAGVPGSANVDINFFAKHFELSGGDIKNAAVQAVFMAAEDSGQITMEHLLASFRREYLKLGKIFPDLKLNISHGTPHESSIKRRERKEAVRHGY